MTDEEKQKLMKIARDAMQIQVTEMEFRHADSDGNPVEGTEHIVAAIYNLENISTEEVEESARSGMLYYDTRILLTDPERLANIFPHRGESTKPVPHAYWIPLLEKNDLIHCQCSECGCKVYSVDAVEIKPKSSEYVGIKYKFCPKCGVPMSHKPPEANYGKS